MSRRLSTNSTCCLSYVFPVENIWSVWARLHVTLKKDIIFPGFSPMIFSLENPTKPTTKRYPADMQSDPDGQFRRHTAAHETRAYFTPREGPS